MVGWRLTCALTSWNRGGGAVNSSFDFSDPTCSGDCVWLHFFLLNDQLKALFLFFYSPMVEYNSNLFLIKNKIERELFCMNVILTEVAIYSVRMKGLTRG